MALRISVDLDGLRWADLFRFVDLARNGGIEPDDQVDVITYGSDPLSVSLSARIYPGADAFAALDADLGGHDPVGRSDGPLSLAPPVSPPPSFGYETSHDRPTAPSSNGSHYPAFDPHTERVAPAAAANGSAFAAYQNQPERPGPVGSNGSQFPPFDSQPDRLPPAPPGGQGFPGFETVFDRGGKEPGANSGVDTPYLEEFARLQEGLIRPAVRRGDESRHDRG
jgi:hypothetical protein